MRLWTIQTPDVADMLRSGKTYRTDPSKSAILEWGESFVEAYDWMAGKMAEHGIDRPDGAEYPVWAWYSYWGEGKPRKPDLRFAGLGPRGKEKALIEIVVDDSRVLLSDFVNWHQVLNGCFLNPARDQEEYDRMEKEYYGTADPDLRRRMLYDSWDNIFNVDYYDGRNGFWNGEAVQAVLWEIRPEDVRSVRIFIAK